MKRNRSVRSARPHGDRLAWCNSRSSAKASRENNMNDYGAGVLAAGKARARRISKAICNERATLPAAKRTSRNVQVIFSRRLKWPCDQKIPENPGKSRKKKSGPATERSKQKEPTQPISPIMTNYNLSRLSPSPRTPIGPRHPNPNPNLNLISQIKPN